MRTNSCGRDWGETGRISRSVVKVGAIPRTRELEEDNHFVAFVNKCVVGAPSCGHSPRDCNQVVSGTETGRGADLEVERPSPGGGSVWLPERVRDETPSPERS